MIHNPVPDSKKIGLISLSILILLAIFVLPMTWADKNKTTENDIAEIESDIQSLQNQLKLKENQLFRKQIGLGLEPNNSAEPVFAAIKPEQAENMPDDKPSDKPAVLGALTMGHVPAAMMGGAMYPQ